MKLSQEVLLQLTGSLVMVVAVFGMYGYSEGVQYDHTLVGEDVQISLVYRARGQDLPEPYCNITVYKGDEHWALYLTDEQCDFVKDSLADGG